MSATDKIAEAKALIEPLRATVLWQNANPNVMKAADLLAALADLADAQAQEIARLRGCFEQIEEAALNGCLTPDLVAQITRAALGATP